MDDDLRIEQTDCKTVPGHMDMWSFWSGGYQYYRCDLTIGQYYAQVTSRRAVDAQAFALQEIADQMLGRKS